MKLIYSCTIIKEHELEEFTRHLIQIIPRNSILLLSGDLAAGKTTLVSYFCKLLKIQMVQSPTYAIHQKYTNNKIAINHFDLYRLETEDELQASGFFDLLNSEADYHFIEWPERLESDVFPLNQFLYKISIKVEDSSFEIDKKIENQKLDLAGIIESSKRYIKVYKLH